MESRAILRYLSDEAKRAELERWREQRLTPRPGGDLGGRGYPDPEIFTWTDRLNDIRGVCTLQSCSGHKRLTGPGWKGELWFWLSESMMKNWNTNAWRLAEVSGFESVRTLHFPELEVADVIYPGLESGRLNYSLTIVEGFLLTLGDKPSDE